MFFHSVIGTFIDISQCSNKDKDWKSENVAGGILRHFSIYETFSIGMQKYKELFRLKYRHEI